MKKLNRLKKTRPKAIFGIDGAIGAAATLAAAGIQASAASRAAREQAEAIKTNAEKQAEALKLQNDNANQNQEKMIEFTRQQNELERQLIKDIQLQGQMQAGNQNDIQMQEMAKIKVRNGGSARRRLRAATGYDASLLQGMSDNLPFTITDGGGVIPIGSTPEGYDLYEIVGNDHEHRHQSRNGSSKTGVGIKFAGGQTIEGEGNQNTNQGEYMLVTPTDAKFISKHTIKGVNPVELVNEGMHPLQAFNIQENIKDAYNISDDGKYARIGRSLKRCGGRKKAYGGYDLLYGNYVPSHKEFANSILGTNNSGNKSSGWWSNLDNTSKGNLWGAGFNALGNVGGALITTIGNNRASKYMQQGYDDAAGILVDAYSKLGGVDMNLLDRNMYRSAHAMAALQAPIVNSGAQRAAAERSLQRNLARINRNTLSSAAAQSRSARAEIDYNDALSQFSSNDDKLRQAIIQENMARITQTANANADRDTQAMHELSKDYLGLLQYNNDIENEAIVGAAQARADAILNKASNIASTKQSNAASWAGATSTSLNGFGNSLATNAKMKNEYDMTMLGATDDAVINSIYANPFSSSSRRNAYSIWLRYKGSNDSKYKNIADDLGSRYGFV